MRCVYCNKKLSLLKLAKGDSFCSAEHFDAHQLQLSKSAFERLMSAPAEDAEKPALIIRIPDPEPAPEPLVHREPLPVRVEAPPPPYAPFAVPAPLSYVVNPPEPMPRESDPTAPVASRPELSFPVHDVEATACLLNLYVRLSLSGTTPLNWSSPRNFVLSAETFATGVIRPSGLFLRALDPPPLENPSPEEPFGLIPSAEPFPPLEEPPAAPPVPAPAMHVEQPRVPFLIAPSFTERTASAAFLSGAATTPTLPALPPVLEDAPRHSHAPGTIAGSTSFAQTAPVVIRDMPALGIASAPQYPVQTSLVLPAAARKSDSNTWHASSPLIERSGTILGIAWQGTRGVDFVPTAPSALLVGPAALHVSRPDPAQLLAGQPHAFRNISPAAGELISAAEPPSPEPPARTSPIPLPAHRPHAPAMEAASLFRHAVGMRPMGSELLFVGQPVPAMEFGLRSILSKKPLAETFSPSGWQNQAAGFSLPAPIFDQPAWPEFPTQLLPYQPKCVHQKPNAVAPPSIGRSMPSPITWLGINPAVPGAELPASSPTLPQLRFSAPQDMAAKMELSASAACSVEMERPFATAPSAQFGRPDLQDVTLTTLPVANRASIESRVNVCKPFMDWTLRRGSVPETRAVKFLAPREDPILPSPKSWARLRSLPR